MRLIELCQPSAQEQVRRLFQTWTDKRQKGAEAIHVEQTAIERILRIAHHLPLVTVGVYLDETLIAFTINEVVQDHYYIGHFGKADPTYRGLGLYLECETAKIMAQMGCRYMNHEEDLGIPGLRTYKESLKLVAFLKKYTISLKV